MKILIEISPEHYNSFLTKCLDTWLLEAAILKNGVLIQRQIEGAKERRIALLCEKHQAHNLLVLARSMESPAAEDIRKALDGEREL